MARASLACRVDANQAIIVRELRDMYISVTVTSRLGDGFGDIVVGHNRRNYLFEIKDPNKPPSERQLTPAEKDFHAAWRGQIDVVETVEDILSIIHEERG